MKFKPAAPYLVYWWNDYSKRHSHTAFSTKRNAFAFAKVYNGAVIDIRTLEYIYKSEDWK